LAFICEDGEMFGEEYTLVACADYVLSKTPRYLICLPRALRDVTNRNNGSYEASAVGEVNVVDLMKRTTPL
jgi:phosphomannomutase